MATSLPAAADSFQLRKPYTATRNDLLPQPRTIQLIRERRQGCSVRSMSGQNAVDERNVGAVSSRLLCKVRRLHLSQPCAASNQHPNRVWRVECQASLTTTDSSSSSSSSRKAAVVAVEVAIVGAGVAGLASALALQKCGMSVVVVERAAELSDGGAALSLWGNAWRALEVLGVAEELRKEYSKLTRIEILNQHGDTLRDFSVRDGVGGREHEVRGVRRGHLLSALEAKLQPGSIIFGVNVKKILDKEPGVELQLSDGTTVQAKALIGCDGCSSQVASHLSLPPPRYCGYKAARGVAQLGAVEQEAGEALGSSIRMIWGRGVRAGMYPLTPSLVYWFTCFNSPERRTPRMSPEQQLEAALRSVEGWSGGIQQIMKSTPLHSISTSDINDRCPSPMSRWGRGCISLAGDAAHPMTPNLGQGACTALEDAVIIAQYLGNGATTAAADTGNPEQVDKPRQRSLQAAEVPAILEAYERARNKRIVPLTLRSYAVGVLLQLPQWPVCFVRDEVVMKRAFQPDHFLDHTLFDCGELPTN